MSLSAPQKRSVVDNKDPNDPNRTLGPILDTMPVLNKQAANIAAVQTPFAAVVGDPVMKLKNAYRLQSSDTGGSTTVIATLKAENNRLYFKDGGIGLQHPIFYITRIEYYRDSTGAAALANPVQVFARIENGDYVLNTTSDQDKVHDSELFNGYHHLFMLTEGAPVASQTQSYQNLATPIGTLQKRQRVDIQVICKDLVTGNELDFNDCMGTRGTIVLTLSGAYMTTM